MKTVVLMLSRKILKKETVLVDTSDMNIEQVVAVLSKIIDEKKAGR